MLPDDSRTGNQTDGWAQLRQKREGVNTNQKEAKRGGLTFLASTLKPLAGVAIKKQIHQMDKVKMN